MMSQESMIAAVSNLLNEQTTFDIICTDVDSKRKDKDAKQAQKQSKTQKRFKFSRKTLRDLD